MPIQNTWEHIFKKLSGFLGLLLVLILPAQKSAASHIFGVDMYYKHVSGLTYTVYLVVYGDCSGSAFSTLPSSAPVIDIYNGGSYYAATTLSIQAPTSGVEVTPVCPAEAANTTCTNPSNPLPGIKKFVYAVDVTLPSTSAAWRFIFGSGMGGSATAGRSGSITNITFGGAGSPIELVDTLNNTSGANSSAEYTTIPTPFFCISTPANYNPGAVDPDGDNLSFNLVPAIDASTGSSVHYVYPYTPTAPLGVTSGTFSFSSSTGQLSFTPNIIQKALVVYNVREFRGGTLVGTSQREMTIVVLSPCTNTPPTGAISSASAGTVVTGTELNICNSVDTFQFEINPTDAEHDSITMTASGLPSGASFNIIGNGSLAPHGTFVWEAATATPGTYTFYITYQDNGCPLIGRQTIAYTVTVLPSPSESVSIISQPTCTRQGIIHITPGSAYSPWMVNELTGSASVHSFTGVTGMITDSLPPGTYTIRTYNPVSCYIDTTITLTRPALPNAAITENAPTCPGGSNGKISVTGTTGASPFEYALGSGSYGTGGVFTGLAPGAYLVHIKDANGCIKDTDVNVPAASPTLETFSVIKPLCDTFSNGRVIIHAYNSFAPYTFALGSGSYSSSDTFSHLAAGSYTFHIKNANGCITDTTFNLVDSLHLHASVTIANILCYGGDATVTLTGTSGFGPPYYYSVDSGTAGTTRTFTLPTGTYSFQVTDSQSCSFDTSIVLSEPTPVSISPTITNINCNGAADGKVIVTASGGTPGYHFSADTGSYSSSDTLSSLTPGSHIIHVKDVNGCIYSDTVTITQPTPVVFDSCILQQPSCHNGSNGVIRIYASGGTPGYTYAINSGTYVSTSTFSGLAAATYTLHIKDSHGCIKDSVVVLSEPSALVPLASVTESSCNTLDNGHIILSATGGTPSYTFAIGGGSYSVSGNFSSLPAGTFYFNIKDANRCVTDTSITITNLFYVSGIFAFTPPLCNGDSNGVITVTGAGGTVPYTFAFGSSAFSGTDTFSHLASGSYEIRIRDSIGCLGDTTVHLSQPAPLVPLITITQPSCFGLSDGSILVNGTGGTSPYTFSLGSGAYITTSAYIGLSMGSDTITIKDTHGCIHDTIFTIHQPLPITITNVNITNVSCKGGADGKVTITGSGGTPAYQFSGNSGAWQTSNVVTGLAAGANIIHLKDSHGCITDTTVWLTEPIALIIDSVVIKNPTCQGYKDGTVYLAATGGTPPYDFSKDNVSYFMSPNFARLPEGNYVFYAQDAHGCITDTAITLTGYPHINIDSILIAGLFCWGNTNGQLTIDASGGIPPFTSTLTGDATSTGPNQFTNINFGEYTVTVTDSKNCSKDSTFTIPHPNALFLTTNVVPNDCTGPENNGTITVVATGGTPPYTYAWSNDTTTASIIIGMPNGSYSVFVSDSNNCKDTASVSIGFNDCCTPFIPKAFTPNGDGKNDEFRVKYRGDIRIIEFAIFNRFGENVFLSEYSEHGWDGTYKGTQAEVGVYYYYIRLICGNRHDKVLEFKGDVTLIR